MTTELTNKLLQRVSIFCKLISKDIEQHLLTTQANAQISTTTDTRKTPEVFQGKAQEDKKVEDDILGEYSDEPYKKFVLSKTKSSVKRKKQDTTKLKVEDYRWVLARRNTDLSTVQWQEFADIMNSTFSTNKSKNSWANIINRKTAYLQSLDY